RASSPTASRGCASRREGSGPGGWSTAGPAKRALRLRAVDGALQLLLVHLRAAVDAELAGLGVELVARAALGPVGARAQAAAARGGHVARRGARARARLARTGALLVHGPRGDLLGASVGG